MDRRTFITRAIGLLTMPASPESYAIASGEVLAGGRFVAPSIAGITWSPDRDLDGNVLRGNWIGLPLRSWVEVAGQVMNDVIQTPHYTYAGFDSAPGIVQAWNGAGWDWVSQKMFINGGGHAASSACETGIYELDAASLKFSRIHDRAPMSDLRRWDTSLLQFVDGQEDPNALSIPLKSLTDISSSHTYWLIHWIPPAVMGNTKGGILVMNKAKGVFDLDTLNYKTPIHWNHPGSIGINVTYGHVFVDGGKAYGSDFNNPNYHWEYQLSGAESSDSGAGSFGLYKHQYHWHQAVPRYSRIYCDMRERRQLLSLSDDGTSFARLRYGAAIDAGAVSWNGFVDTITLTSSDGSHLDFNATMMGFSGNTEHELYCAGACYDSDEDCIYVVGVTAGAYCYKITGLSGTTLTTEKIAGSQVTRTSPRGVYGRARLAKFGEKKFLIRVSGTLHPVQVMRVSQ